VHCAAAKIDGLVVNYSLSDWDKVVGVNLRGAFETGLFLELSDEQKNKIQKKTPSKKLGDSSNIVNAIDFLIKSEYVNGSTINVDSKI
jgi:NAD(P)-dependent dehydrogenase (short-subunit alcohol dehydrogenase family)